MRAAIYNGPFAVQAENVPDPQIEQATDAIVNVACAAVCGSDLWTYRGQGGVREGSRIGHEFAGVVAKTGPGVTGLKTGDWVVAPFRYSDGTCVHCQAGLESSCVRGGFWGRHITEAGQADQVRVPFADATLVKALPGGEAPDQGLSRHLLTLADVLPTGYHGASRAGVGPGATTAVVGDGAVGLCAVLAARLLGAERVLAFGAHADRLALATSFGATEVFRLRGAAAAEAAAEATGGLGADQVIEAVGTPDAFATALKMVRAGGVVSYVGLPHGVTLDLSQVFPTNVTITGGIAPARHYIPLLAPKVAAGEITPGDVFTATFPLAEVDQAYRQMDQRGQIKALLTP
ncbi:MAG: zinc-binding dehydrogenase [Bifidobacteriaceae bacterium]|jgi:threonine dehydrogenase-like Zn-dependent dehydrogenase|nr:zinc-binding dehydrogenase [Bifidobacteriaceae bacterium]